MNAQFAAFLILSVLAVVSALAVIMQRSAVSSAFALALNLLSIAGFYLLLNAQFAALLQVIVYTGAILVLILFVIMLLNLSDERAGNVRPIQRVLGIVGAAGLAAVLIRVFVRFEGRFEAPTDGFGTVSELGQSMFTTYFYPFEAISLLLIVAMIGAVLLAKRRL